MARLAIVLGDVASRAATGRLHLAGTADDSAGMMMFHLGILVGLHPPAPEGPLDLARADVATARRAVMMAAAQAALGTTPPFFSSADIAERPAAGAVRLTAGDLALDVARLVEDAGWLEERLGVAAGALAARSTPPPASPSAALGPHDGILLKLSNGNLQVASLLTLVPLSRLDALRALFGLQAAGLIRCEAPARELSDLDQFLERTATRGVGMPLRPPATAPAGARAAVPAAVPAAAATPGAPAPPASRTAQKAPASPAARSSPGAPVPPSPPSPQTTQRPPEPVGRSSGPEQQERDALLERCRDISGQDHYTILGVEHSASEAVIRAAYYRLARLYHPDRLRKPHLEDILRDLEGMFAAITEAYNTLSNAASRAAYDQERHHAAAGGRKRDGQDRVSSARDAYLRGRKAAEAGQLYEAIRLFEVAVENDPSRPEHFHHLGVCQGQNPRWRKKAEENLLQAIKMNPSSVAGYVELARLYRKGGLERRCLEMYEQVLRWDPDHREALAETAAARGAAGAPGGSKLRGLFRKE